MASLRTAIGTSTPKQRQTLVLTARRQGLSVDQLRDYVGGSLRQLSAKEASAWISRLGGGDLPHQPGQKPAPYAGKRRRTDAVRMICDDHVEQIERLMGEHFDSQGQSTAWLHKNFDAALSNVNSSFGYCYYCGINMESILVSRFVMHAF